jgi:hypothetical protein
MAGIKQVAAFWHLLKHQYNHRLRGPRPHRSRRPGAGMYFADDYLKFGRRASKHCETVALLQ